MSYTTQARIQSAIPAPLLADALDDNRDGIADEGLLDEIIASTDQAVDAFLAAKFEVPISPTPAVCAEASFTFACERIYDRREIAERNPWRSRADYWRERLAKIGAGEEALDSTVDVAAGAAGNWNSKAKLPTRFDDNANDA